jgi:hypothetical protein
MTTAAKTQQEQPAPPPSVYERLSAPFDTTFKDHRGGIELEYITGEQTVSRLNEVLGVNGWSFRVLEHGYNEEADEHWVLAEIAATIEGVHVLRQQFGSQKVKRSRANSNPLDIGFDLKGATTDALKKCASLLGVGLYLSKKEIPVEIPAPVSTNGHSTSGQSTNGHEAQVADAKSSGPLACVDCGEELKETRFKDGTVWAPAQLAAYGRRKHGRVLCMSHYREANDAVRRAQSLEAVPF